jgi:hypothetical protein
MPNAWKDLEFIQFVTPVVELDILHHSNLASVVKLIQLQLMVKP